MNLEFNPVRSGFCTSKCGRVVINKAVSQQTGRADEACWEIRIGGRVRATVDTLSYAKKRAAQLIEQDAKK